MAIKANSYFRLWPMAKRDWKNFPNMLTLARCPMSIIVFYCLVRAQPYAASWWYVATALTDFVDGKWARHFHQETEFGENMDPIMDKALVLAVGLGLCINRWPNPWLLIPVGIILVREASVMALVDYFRQRHMKLSVTWAGKLKTFAQGIAFYLCIRNPTGDWVWPVRCVVFTAVLLTVVSGVDYIVRARGLLRPIPEEDSTD
jgi:CDP-diacylglycerol--glycerol-3-phosphate 3-phosphatidyltransferase